MKIQAMWTNIADKLFENKCNACGHTPAYADDSMHVTRHKREDNQQHLAESLNDIATFLESNRLTVNQSKTQLIETKVPQKRTRLPPNPPILAFLDEKGEVKIIQCESHIRLLGINLSNNLNWTAHLISGEKPLFNTVKSKLGALNLIRHEIPMKARLILANGIILSRLHYMIPVWGGIPRSRVRQLQLLLSLTARFVTGCPRITSAVRLMKKCGWWFASEMIRFHTLMALWRTIMDNQSNYFNNKILKCDNFCLQTSIPHLKTTKLSFRWRAVSLWNNLSLSTRMSTNTAPVQEKSQTRYSQ